ncbi:MAG TPA: ATP-dependent DNA helicase [Candidatus Saccharimonadales bacterium]|nr:ATP-dependent DNA helicase [Candidatus Saccharimonadales bacterium]
MKSKFEEAYAQLNVAQKRAVDTTEGPVLVIAGPGTGKTQLLTTRIANILAKTDAGASNILCLTFTESGAQTMRERLTNFIGQNAYDVTISTYHAFGSDLIRRFPDYFSELADTRPVDDLGVDSIFRELVGKLPYSNPLKFADNYLNDIRALVSDAKRALLKPDDLHAVAQQNLAFIRDTTPIVQKNLAGVVRIDKKAAPLFEVLLNALISVEGPGSPVSPIMLTKAARAGGPPRTAAPGFVEGITSLAQLFVGSLAEAIEQTNKSGKTTALTAWKNAWLAKDEHGAFVVDGEKANRKLAAAADIYAGYLHELEKRKLFDYDDMILRAVHALETHADLRYTLQEQYLYILLDEFQDTNGAQLRLVELLTDNPVHEARPNVLAVGDDDQAIYAFQGANYSHMLKFQQLYRDVLLVPLTQNYRSHADVLHVARGVAEQIEERLHHHFPAIEKTLTAENKNLPKNATVERIQAKSDVAQFSWVAKKIRTLLDSGMPASEIAVIAPQHKYLEPLMAFMQQENVPIRYEKRENVLDDPVVAQLLRMSELCVALSTGDHAMANNLWAEVLSYDFWQLPTSLIWQLSWQANDGKSNWTGALLENDTLRPVVLFFVRLGMLLKTETLETMLDYLIGVQPLDVGEPGFEPFTSPFYTFHFGVTTDPGVAPRGAAPKNSRMLRLQHSVFLGADEATGPPTSASTLKSQRDFWNLLTNLIVLRARLREYKASEDGPLTLPDFLEFVAAHRAANIKILNTSPYQEATEAVQLLTAFKAKGQEYTAVFVVAVNDEAWGSKTRGQVSRLSIPPNLQFIRYAGATNDERLRLFYVAVTRAKSQLYLVNYTNNYSGKALTRLKYLNETEDEQKGGLLSLLLPAGAQIVQTVEDGAVSPTTELEAYWQRRHYAALGSSNLKAMLARRLAQLQLSPTHVSDFTDVANCGPEAFFLKTILRFPQAPRPEIQFGNAMHETLEWIHIAAKQDGVMPNEKAVLRTFGQRLRAKRLSPQSTELLLARGHESLHAYWAQRQHTVSRENRAEYNFRTEGVFVGQTHVGGKIDKLIVDPVNKTIVIVDYKTGRAHRRWAHEIKLHKYELQLYFYRLLVEGSNAFAGYKVTDAYLEFVEPDEQGNIIELHAAFDDAKMQALKQLIQAVGGRIRALELPTTDAYSKDLRGIEAFEQDLIDSII